MAICEVVIVVIDIVVIIVVVNSTITIHTLHTTTTTIVIVIAIVTITPLTVLNRLAILLQHLISITNNNKNISYLALVINVNIKLILPFISSSSYILTLDFTGL